MKNSRKFFFLALSLLAAAISSAAFATGYDGSPSTIGVVGTVTVVVTGTPTVEIIGTNGKIAGVAPAGTAPTVAAPAQIVALSPNLYTPSSSPFSCLNVSTTATILAANSNRLAFSAWISTSSTATFYLKYGTGATVPPADGSANASGGFTGAGAGWSDNGENGTGPLQGIISAVCKTGTCWLCTYEVTK